MCQSYKQAVKIKSSANISCINILVKNYSINLGYILRCLITKPWQHFLNNRNCFFCYPFYNALNSRPFGVRLTAKQSHDQSAQKYLIHSQSNDQFLKTKRQYMAFRFLHQYGVDESIWLQTGVFTILLTLVFLCKIKVPETRCSGSQCLPFISLRHIKQIRPITNSRNAFCKLLLIYNRAVSQIPNHQHVIFSTKILLAKIQINLRRNRQTLEEYQYDASLN